MTDDFDGTSWVEPPKMAKLMSRSALFAVAAAAMARQGAGLGAEDADPERTGVVLGAAPGMGPTDNDLLATQARAMLESAESADVQRYLGGNFLRVFEQVWK